MLVVTKDSVVEEIQRFAVLEGWQYVSCSYGCLTHDNAGMICASCVLTEETWGKKEKEYEKEYRLTKIKSY